MDIRYKGRQKEKEAEEHIKNKFGSVKPHKRTNDFYDYLTYIENQKYYIEVKYVLLKGKNTSGNTRMSYNQFTKLMKQKNVLVYVMTNRGNKFISKRKLLLYTHQHYNYLNPTEKNFTFSVKEVNGKIKPVHLKYCQYCDGTATKCLK